MIAKQLNHVDAWMKQWGCDASQQRALYRQLFSTLEQSRHKYTATSGAAAGLSQVNVLLPVPCRQSAHQYFVKLLRTYEGASAEVLESARPDAEKILAHVSTTSGA
jgi:hypothetical protein